MMYLDQESMELYKLELAEGKLPQQADEIVVSPGILEALGQPGGIGDPVTVPYQIYRDGSLDLTQQKEFRICGFFEDSEANQEQRAYTALISEAFLKNEVPKEDLAYRFLLQADDTEAATTDKMEERIKNIAVQFGIPEDEININEDYLTANYVDPVMIPAIILIVVIVVLAGVITVYSIYYVSMNHKIQEFGKLKAIGATKRQIRQIVLREGLCVAAVAIPAGLLAGTLASKAVLSLFLNTTFGNNEFIKVVKDIFESGEVTVCYWWAYLIAVIVTLCTVYLSLVRPMHVASRIPEVEAMRAHVAVKNQSSRKKGYEYITVGRLTCRNLMENRKKSMITILSMASTGVFLMIVATVLSCANPTESANSSLAGQYELSPVVEENNREHPERKWASIQKDNPLNETLKEQIEKLPGVKRVDTFTNVRVSGGPFMEEDYNSINGILGGICRGTGKRFEIAAIGDYGSGMTNYAYLIMAKGAADRLCENNSSSYFYVIADKNYDEKLEKALSGIIEASGRIGMRTWKAQYDTWKSAMTMTSGACYAFLRILAAISVMNLINTMLNSVHVRKKELGMMQAIGMSDAQLVKMLQMEGLFYTLGTLVISVGLGSLAGYPVFLYAKKTGMFDISAYHYPITAAVTVSAVLLLIQVLLALSVGRTVKKDSLIERIRFSE